VGDEVIFLPSEKRSKIQSIEGFNVPGQNSIGTDHATGFTLTTQIFVKAGEMMCKADSVLPNIGTQFKANIFWLGKSPLVRNKRYKLKLATARIPVVVKEIINVLNAAELSSEHKDQVARHEVAEVVLETLKPVAFDPAAQHPGTSRFVIVDNYEIAGGGIVIENRTAQGGHTMRSNFDVDWKTSSVDAVARAKRIGHSAVVAVIYGKQADLISQELERRLFQDGKAVYRLGANSPLQWERLVEMSYILADSGQIVIAAIAGDAHDATAIAEPLSRFPVVTLDSAHVTVAQAAEAVLNQA
ncbi:adenylyl-sulfate kinase, partial [bacterium]|nr:adenylyl-sulfate kinase [bacterium]